MNDVQEVGGWGELSHLEKIERAAREWMKNVEDDTNPDSAMTELVQRYLSFMKTLGQTYWKASAKSIMINAAMELGLQRECEEFLGITLEDLELDELYDFDTIDEEE